MKTSNKFFEGADFHKKDFKALIPKYYPPKYKKYIQQETRLLKKAIEGADRVLEAGVGVGRLIPILSPLVREFVGVDNADLMLRQAQKFRSRFKNVKIVPSTLETVGRLFPKNYFDCSLCVWNTLGNVKDEVRVLKELKKVTSGKIVITVYKKGTVEDRKNWYKTVGIKIKKIDLKNEIFYSESGLRSRSYSSENIKKMATSADLQIKNLLELNGVILYAELSKK